MVENYNQSTNYDAVLGEQAPLPEEGVVLERLEELRQRFALPTVEQRVAALSDALKYGDAGVALLVAAMKDEALIVRVNAYKLLLGLSTKAQQAIENGILIHPGDYFYCVYETGIHFDDEEYHFIDSVNEDYEDVSLFPYYEDDGIDEYYDDYYDEGYGLKFVSRYLFRDKAEAEAELLHQQKILEADIDIFPRNPVANFNIDEWCAVNGVSLDRQYQENQLAPLGFEDWEWRKMEDIRFGVRLLKTLQENKNIELISQLWNLLGLTRLAFVHEHKIKHKGYFQISGTIQC